MTNPLLTQGQLPTFTTFKPDDIKPALTAIIAQNQTELKKLLSANTTFTWNNLMVEQDEMGEKLSRMWTPVSHLHSVLETDELREAYNACLPILTEYHTQIMQDADLFNAVQSIATGPEYTTLNNAQRKVIDNEIRDFKLAGVNLPQDKKVRFAEIQQELSKLTTQYAENLLDATHAYTLPIESEAQLKGLPEESIEMLAQNAKHHGKTGWLITLEFPCYIAIMKYLDDRSIRRTLYEAYSTRASDIGPNGGRWDNSTNMENILRLRHEMANLVGYPNYAEYSLATKMASTPKLVLDFLYNLVEQSRTAAKAEFAELIQFAQSLDKIETVENWDFAYYTEKLRQQKYAISQEELKPYFPAQKVLDGMFATIHQLYGIRITEKTGVDVWHPQVKYFEIYDQNNTFVGSFYTDLYARPHKRDGAWMDECRVRRILKDGTLQFPIAFLTCNFTPPVGDKPALLTQDEVETVFHEFGHCLHHLLTRVDYAAVSGINGVPWDAVEFPSQIMEHWCWDKKTIALISGHYQTNEPLPDALLKKMQAAKYFQSGMQMVRQLEFSLFDFRIHLEYDPKQGGHIQKILDEVRAQVAVVPYPKTNRFQHSFSHIFAGGYAAGYYSYKWAEVLSSDAFSLFEETGTFNRQTGLSFLENILQRGGVRDPMEGFIAFRGREPRIDALLRHSGLTPEKIK